MIAENEEIEEPVTPTLNKPTMYGDVTSICYVEN